MAIAMGSDTVNDKDNTILKSALKKNLMVFHDFCESHKLTYYLSDGTLLGAIRHQGFIPWDDDVDVSMPRADYKKLLKLAHKFPYPYSLKHFYLDSSHIYSMAKLVDDNTELLEYYGDKKNYIKTGVWLDVFPLDGTYANPALRKLHNRLTEIFSRLFKIRTRVYYEPQDIQPFIQNMARKCFKPLIYRVLKVLPPRAYFFLMDYCISHVPYQKAKVVASGYAPNSFTVAYPKKWFQKRAEVTFEGDSFYGPVNYDGYLTMCYGDYMTPLPPEEREAHNIEIISIPNE